MVCNGAIVEDIDNYKRVCRMSDLSQSSDKCINGAVEGCGHDDTALYFNFNTLDDHPGAIGQGNNAMVGFSLCSGLFTQDKLSLLKHAPRVIELELVGNATDCLGTGNNGNVSPLVNSPAWVIEQPQIKCDIVTLDSELQRSYAAYILTGMRLPTHFSSYATNVHQALGKDNAIPIARSCTHLKSAFVRMFHGDGSSTHHNAAN